MKFKNVLYHHHHLSGASESLVKNFQVSLSFMIVLSSLTMGPVSSERRLAWSSFGPPGFLHLYNDAGMPY